jgi:aminoglycoside phosphotransferase (APT) family kinase protein
MTEPGDPVSPAADFPAAAASAMREAAAQAELDARGARLIRLFGTAVYHLPAAGAVARIALETSPQAVARLATAVEVTRWLASIGFPAAEPLPVAQPVAAHDCVVTFWRYLAETGSAPSAAELGGLLRELHQLGPPPVTLPGYRPLTSVRRAIEASRGVGEDDRAWLRERCDHSLGAYDKLDFVLPAGMIHGDAWRGNLLRDGNRVVLLDWDTVSTGPREIDLVPTLQATRFGLPRSERDAFITAYGRDIRAWDGYPTLREVRELSTLSAILRDAHVNSAAERELRIRIQSLRTGDSQRWMAF